LGEYSSKNVNSILEPCFLENLLGLLRDERKRFPIQLLIFVYRDKIVRDKIIVIFNDSCHIPKLTSFLFNFYLTSYFFLSQVSPIILAGFPATIAYSGTSFTTTEPAHPLARAYLFLFLVKS